MVCRTASRDTDTTSSLSESVMGDKSCQSDNDASVLDKDSNIRVVVRVRPPNSREKSSEKAIKVMGPHCLVFDPNEQDTDEFGNRSSGRKQNFLGRKSRDLKFAFDRVLDETAQNIHAYQHSAKFVVDGVLSGYNCSVFAYGATGAGKTHTMLGTKDEPGVMYRTMQDLYAYMAKVNDQCCVDVSVSYLEVYNEDVRDLLMPKRCSLPVREDPEQGVIVQGLSLHKPQSMQELLHMLDFGNTNRSQHPTDANAESSRSHAVFQVFIRQKPRGSGLQAKVRCAKMSLIDLAGSERATMTKNMGKRFREGANINRSLLALGNVINALASGKTKGKHVPYRDSKLTRILKDSLGGNCRTVMIAAVSPSQISFEDTYNTLRYAERTKSIKADVRENVLSVDLHIHNYAKIVEELRNENRDLREKLSVRPEPTLTLVSKYSIDPDILGLKVHIDNVYSERLNVHRELMEIESSDRDLQMKLFYKRQSLVRYQLICLTRSDVETVCTRSEASSRSMESRRTNLASRRQKALQRLRDNATKLELVHTDCRAVTDDNSLPEVLALTDDLRKAEIQLADQRRQVKYLKKMARQQQREVDVRDRLLSVALTALRIQYVAVAESGQLLPDTYRNLVQLVGEQNREVVWADQTLPDPEPSAFNIQEVLNFPPITPALDSTSGGATSPKRRTPRRKRSARSPRTLGRTLETTTGEAEASTTLPSKETSPRLTEAAGRTPFPKLCLDSPLDGTTELPPSTSIGFQAKDSLQCNINSVSTERTPSGKVENCDTNVNSLTVTKSKNDWEKTKVKVQNGTFTKATSLYTSEATRQESRTSVMSVVNCPGSGVNTTVTKTEATAGTDGTGSRRSSAVRSMTFVQTPPRNSTFSYADIVRSPGGTESPLPACVISPIALTPAAALKRAPSAAGSVQRTPAGSVQRTAAGSINRLSASPAAVLNESYTIDATTTSAVVVRPTSSQSSSSSKTTKTAATSTLTPHLSSSSQPRRPLTDQANVMTSRLPVRSPCSDQRRRVQFQDDQENRGQTPPNKENNDNKSSSDKPLKSRTACENAQKLEKYGLPSLSVPSDNKNSRKALKRTAPGYMRMTHAAEGKTKQNGGGGGRTSRQGQAGLQESRDGAQAFKRSTSLNRLDTLPTRTFSRTKSTTHIPTR